jgi:hypothetical protein
MIALLYLPLPDPLGALSNLSGRSHLFTLSLPTLVKLALQLGGVSEPISVKVTLAATLLALGAWYLVQLARTWKEPKTALESAYSFILFFLLFAVPWFQPWYVTWLVSLAALAPVTRARAQSSLFSFTVLPSYVVYGFVWFWIVPIARWGNYLALHLIGVTVTFLAPWAHAAWLWLRARSQAART